MIDAKIRTLISLSETKSYTRTAKELNLTQPAVSHHVKLLEQEYGIEIFVRMNNKLKITPEGEILLKYARRIDALDENTRREINDYKNSVRHISIGITPTISEIFIPKIIAEYVNEHSDVTVSISTDTVKKLQDKLRKFDIDIAVIEGDFPADEFSSCLLDTDSLVLITSKQHRLADCESVSFSDIKDENFIMRTKKSGTRTLFDSYLAKQPDSLRNLKVIIEIDNTAVIKELVANNVGISVMSKSVCDSDEREGRLSVIPLEHSNMRREINMIYNKTFTHDEILNELRSIYEHVKLNQQISENSEDEE